MNKAIKLITNFYKKAKISNILNSENPNLKVWGDGSPTRDFLYVEDAAKVICKLIKYKEKRFEENKMPD